MARPYSKLRGLMAAGDLTNLDIARYLNLSKTSVSHRLMAHEPWRIDEMYALLRIFGLPNAQLHTLFPEGGKNEATSWRA